MSCPLFGGQATDDATTAISQAAAAGAPSDFFCYFAFEPQQYDFNLLNSDLPKIYDYLDGAASKLGSNRVGFYGFYSTVTAVLDNHKAAKAWQTSGQSGGLVDSRAVLYQYSYAQSLPGAPSDTYDVNNAYVSDIGQWTFPPGITAYSSLGVAVPYCPLTIDGTQVGSTSNKGSSAIPTLCGNHLVAARRGNLWYNKVINFICSLPVSRTASEAPEQAGNGVPGNQYLIDLDSDASCANLSQQGNFAIGDRIEVYGTGNGLRARYPDPCSDAYAVMPDLSAGTIVGSWQCCNGYIRWKIRYDGLSGIDVWSAEGEPSTGQLFLRKKQNSTCSYSLAPNWLDLDTSGAAASGFNVNTGASCYWTAVSNLDWISITTNGSGSGPAQVTFSVTANNTPYSRTGNIIVGDQTFIVTQPGNGGSTSGWALTVASSNPNSGVNVAVSPNDTNGLGNGVTSFTRNYNAYTQVFLTAPAGAGSTTFKKWQRDGVDWSTSTGTNLTMEGNHTMTAVYVPVPDRYLAVFISPQQANDAGAKWYLQGNGPYDSGYSLGPLSPGSTVPGLTFKPINGWIAPPDQSVMIANSGATIVRVTYTLAPSLLLSANQISIGSSSGGANLLVTNTGGGNLNWLASTADDWITLELFSGSAAAGASNPLSFTFTPNNSSVSRNATITVADSSANGSPQSITVSQLGKLQVTSVARPNANTFTLSWTADPAHAYSVLRSSDLSFTTYDVIVSGVPGSNPTFTDTTLPPNTTTMFYKVRLDP
jgi:hypothetical protein